MSRRCSEGAPSEAFLCFWEAGFFFFLCSLLLLFAWGVVLPSTKLHSFPNGTFCSFKRVLWAPDCCLVKESSNDPISFPWFNEQSRSVAAQTLPTSETQFDTKPSISLEWLSNADIIPVFDGWEEVTEQIIGLGWTWGSSKSANRRSLRCLCKGWEPGALYFQWEKQGFVCRAVFLPAKPRPREWQHSLDHCWQPPKEGLV